MRPARLSVKVHRRITGISPKKNNPDILIVTFEDGGKVANIRRDLIDVYPGSVYLPKWLDDKIFYGGS